MPVHNNLNNFKKWVEVDVTDSPVRNKILNMIKDDDRKDSPTIVSEIDGKYSPFRPHLSELGKTQLDMLKAEKKLRSTAYVLLAAVKFKKLISKKSVTT